MMKNRILPRIAVALLALAGAAACSMGFDDPSPVFLIPDHLYSGQTYKITRFSTMCNYEWTTSDPQIARVLVNPVDSVATLLVHPKNSDLYFYSSNDPAGASAVGSSFTGLVGQTTTKGLVEDVDDGTTTVVVTAMNKLHREYTYELKTVVRLWALACVNSDGKMLTEINAGDTFTVAMCDYADFSVIKDIDDGHIIGTNREVSLSIDQVTEVPEGLELVSSDNFSATFKALSAGTYSFTATLLNGCTTDTDVTSTATLAVK